MSHYVKLTFQSARPDIASFDALAELNAWRRKLLHQHLLGMDSNGVAVRQRERKRRSNSEFLH